LGDGELDGQQNHKKSSIRAIIFDMGGVILRTEDQTPRIELAKQYGISPAELSDAVFNTPLAIQGSLGKIPEEAVWQGIAEHFHLSKQDAEIFQEAFWRGDVLDRELVNFISGLRPRYKTGLLSNAWSGARAMMDVKHQALHAFDVAVFSAEVGLAKPDERIYQFILKQLEVLPEEAIFIDDFPENIAGAQKCGLKTIWFQNRDQMIEEFTVLLGRENNG
jgi:HAD superfamily hydrolase (TIGR01509 family)